MNHMMDGKLAVSSFGVKIEHPDKANVHLNDGTDISEDIVKDKIGSLMISSQHSVPLTRI